MFHVNSPINLQKWVQENEHLLMPPVCNKVLFEEEEAFVMVLGGANKRQEFHYNESPELFYQYKGDMVLKIREEGQVKDLTIHEGEMFLLPPRVAHSPVRFEDTIGVVVDMRHPDKKDGLIWFCPSCGDLVHEEYLKVEDVENDFQPVYDRFYEDEDLHKCKSCDYHFVKQ